MITKGQALYTFWAGFGLPAFDENTVPDEYPAGVKLAPPYITFESAAGALGDNLTLNASLWYLSMSWEAIEAKTAEIAAYIGRGGRIVPFEGGTLWIKRGGQFSHRMDEANNDKIRRMLLTVEVEYLSAD